MSAISLEEAQAHLPELIERLGSGEEITILQQDRPIARLVAEPKIPAGPRKPGSLKGSVLYMAPDFDAPLEDFREYME